MRVGVIVPMGDEDGAEAPRSYAEIKAYAVAVEDAGLDSVWVYDHLLAEGLDDPENSPWEAWSVLCGLVEATSRVRLGTLVMCTSFRPAGVLARMADTVQEMSGNRLVLGIGAGWHQPEYRAFGLPFEPRVSGFEEAAQVITGMLRGGEATGAGTHHSADRAPVRARPGRVAPEILIAARRPRMLRLAAQ
jgi:alkanesulfonate monooxygenase SsuD/methylene tetrahydromethanopterin reductase-like flavin-dependent oxidoreductase (luciferase family)